MQLTCFTTINRSLQNHEILQVHLSHQSPMIPNLFSSNVQMKLPVDRHQHTTQGPHLILQQYFKEGVFSSAVIFPNIHCLYFAANAHVHLVPYSSNLPRSQPSNSLVLPRASALHLIKQNLFLRRISAHNSGFLRTFIKNESNIRRS